jgi:hypothetical protein
MSAFNARNYSTRFSGALGGNPSDTLSKLSLKKKVMLCNGNYDVFIGEHRNAVGKIFGTLEEAFRGKLPLELASIGGILREFPQNDEGSAFERHFPNLTKCSTPEAVRQLSHDIFGVYRSEGVMLRLAFDEEQTGESAARMRNAAGAFAITTAFSEVWDDMPEGMPRERQAAMWKMAVDENNRNSRTLIEYADQMKRLVSYILEHCTPSLRTVLDECPVFNACVDNRDIIAVMLYLKRRYSRRPVLTGYF